MNSLWPDTVLMPHFPQLKQDIRTDVLIIGGGIAGLLCASLLHRAGADCILAEAETICSGITKNTTAKITSQHGFIYDKLIREFGEEKACQYLHANESAVRKYRELCTDIDCDFTNADSFTYCVSGREKADREINALKRIGHTAEFCDRLPLPFRVDGAVRFKKQAQFNPLKFAAHIAKGLQIYEHTPVRELIGTQAVTDFGRITAQRIIVATHYPFLNKHGSYFLKMYQHRSYVIALENAPDVHGMYIDGNKNGMSFRNYGGFLLVGGGSHRTGKKGGNWQELRSFAAHYYPQAKVKYFFATQDCMTLDSVPYIGPYSAATENLYVATGFNKWGMSSAMAAATILCDMLQGRQNPYAEVFSPSRTILRPQLAANAFEAVTGLLTPTAKRCPHLGCALKWNPYEHTWDCSCHGSRFTDKGQVIDNPATGNLKNKQPYNSNP